MIHSMTDASYLSILNISVDDGHVLFKSDELVLEVIFIEISQDDFV